MSGGSTLAGTREPRAYSILLVEDDQRVAEVVARYLEREGFAVRAAYDGEGALSLARQRFPDLVVLDLALPGALDGLDVLRELRRSSNVPVIVLSARSEPANRVVGLEAGADDYLAKPFSPRELGARVHAVLRRFYAVPGSPDVPELLAAGAIEVEPKARTVRLNGEERQLTALEFDLLVFFLRHPSEAFTREALLEQVWGYRHGDASTVTVHVHRLREKIEPDPGSPRHIMTVWGVGYRFDP